MDCLYDTAGLSIFYDPINNWLYAEWRGKHSAESAQTGGEMILAQLAQYPVSKMLSDNTDVTTEWEQGARWVGTHYYAVLAERGVRSVAWICPPEWPGRKSMEAAMQYVTRPMVVLFDDLASACAWLMRQA